MAIEEAEYSVVFNEENYEVRQYEAHVVAETFVDGTLEDAGSEAFRPLFNYISGGNQSQRQVEMTVPRAVLQEIGGQEVEGQEVGGQEFIIKESGAQESVGEKIAMTAPVGQQRKDGRWVVSFMMPARYSLETLPTPDNPNVLLRQVAARYMAAIRYSGFWSENNYRRHLHKLNVWMQKHNLNAAGNPLWARYNAPLVPWFLRRNEILIAVEMPLNDAFEYE